MAPIKDGHRLLQRRYGLIIILIGCGAVGLFLWRYPSLQPYLAATGSGAAAFFGAVPGLVSRKMRGRLLTLVSSGVVVALVTTYTNVSLQRQIEGATVRAGAESKRAEDSNGELQEYMRFVSDGEKQLILLKASDFVSNLFYSVKAPYKSENFEPARDVTLFMLTSDRNNGHALYWLGEIARALRDFDKEHSNFLSYIEEERHRSDSREGGTDIIACRRPDGYCLQRTAWIHHLLANDFYSDGVRAKDPQNAVDEFRNAIDHACLALHLYPANPRKPQAGFSGKGQGIATDELVAQLQTQLHKLRAEAPTCSK